MRGATIKVDIEIDVKAISIHAPHAGRDARCKYICIARLISIHAPHAGRDDVSRKCCCSGLISIHAPHAGRDNSLCISRDRPTDFNPRAPCGARQKTQKDYCEKHYFNPRAPCGARPPPVPKKVITPLFQSTRPMRGATIPAMARITKTSNFNPRAPCGARLGVCK